MKKNFFFFNCLGLNKNPWEFQAFHIFPGNRQSEFARLNGLRRAREARRWSIPVAIRLSLFDNILQKSQGDSLRPRIPKGARVGFHKPVLESVYEECLERESACALDFSPSRLPPAFALPDNDVPDTRDRFYTRRERRLSAFRTLHGFFAWSMNEDSETGANREDRKSGINCKFARIMCVRRIYLFWKYIFV